MVEFIIPPDMISYLLKYKHIQNILVSSLIMFMEFSCSGNNRQVSFISPTAEMTTTSQTDYMMKIEETVSIESTREITPTLTITASRIPVQELVLWHGLDDRGILALGEIMKNFQRENPDIHIQAVYVPYDDLLERYIQAVDSDSVPDLLLGAGEWGTMLYNLNAIAAIPKEILRELRFDINPSAYSAVVYEDTPIALPYSLHGIVMFRNSSILSNAPETFEELVISSQKVTKGRIVGAYLERGDLFAYGQLTACGGALMFPNGYPAFNNSSGLCWLNLLSMFETAGPVSFNSDDDLNRFKAGNVGLIFAGTWHLSALQDSLGDDVVIDLWPEFGDFHLSGYVWTENIYLSANLTEEAYYRALAFSQFFLSPESQAVFAEIGIIPATLYRDVKEQIILQAVAALTKGTQYPLSPEMELYIKPMHEALLAVFEENIAPSIVLETAEDRIMDLIDDFSEAGEEF